MDILKLIFLILWFMLITKLVINVASQVKIVEFFEELLKKINWVFVRKRE